MGFEFEEVPEVEGISSDSMSGIYLSVKEQGALVTDTSYAGDLAETMNEQYGFGEGEEGPWTAENGDVLFEGDLFKDMTPDEFSDAHTAEIAEKLKTTETPELFNKSKEQVEKAQEKAPESSEKLKEKMKTLKTGEGTTWAEFAKDQTPWVKKLLEKAAMLGLAYGLLDIVADSQTGCYRQVGSNSIYIDKNSGNCNCAGHADQCQAWCNDMLDAVAYGADCCKDSCADKDKDDDDDDDDDDDTATKCVQSKDEDGNEVQTGGRCGFCNCLSSSNRDVELLWVKRSWQDVFTDISSAGAYIIEDTVDAGLDLVEATAGLIDNLWVYLVIAAGAIILIVIIVVVVKAASKKKSKTAAKNKAPPVNLEFPSTTSSALTTASPL